MRFIRLYKQKVCRNWCLVERKSIGNWRSGMDSNGVRVFIFLFNYSLINLLITLNFQENR